MISVLILKICLVSSGLARDEQPNQEDSRPRGGGLMRQMGRSQSSSALPEKSVNRKSFRSSSVSELPTSQRSSPYKKLSSVIPHDKARTFDFATPLPVHDSKNQDPFLSDLVEHLESVQFRVL